MKNKFIFMRGLPGSGKSTKVKELKEKYKNSHRVEHLSTDFYFEHCGKYEFDQNKLKEYHTLTFAEFCKYASESSILKHLAPNIWVPYVIILDNTNTQWREFSLYVQVAHKLGFEIEQCLPNTPWAFDIDGLVAHQTHGVPRETLEKMLARFDSFEKIEVKLNGYKS